MNFRKTSLLNRKNSRNIKTSSEKWRPRGRNISRRDNENIQVDSEEDIKKASELKDWVDEFLVSKSQTIDRVDQDVEVKLNRKQTFILSTLVPDEILLMEKFTNSDLKRFVGCLLMADVSGYTALSEKYNTAKGGTYRLTATLNTYLGSLIEVIYSHGGDIIKFAGDAFLALWKTDKRTFLSHTIHNVIACALIIQHCYGSFETDVKVNLRVKLAISAGNLIFTPIGSGIDMSYVITGLPVLEAKIAESVCASGEVKLTPSAWGHCYSRNYDHVISDDGHVTIKSILYDPHEKDVSKPFLGFGAMLRQINKPYTTLEDLPDFLLEPTNNISSADLFKRNELLSLRKTILIGEKKNIGSEIRKFMIRPVLTQIDAHQPLEYLTEMRQVSVLFLTLKPIDCPFPQLITIVNNAYQITCDIVYKSMGCVNKIILFDKDVMILVIFGLRGFKHESEAQAALKCAYSVKKSVSALDGVLNVSIGVTTGQVYCGVIGHPLRREFTVIGTIVNKAARFMCSFRNKITCDEATFVQSKMSSNGFTLQPPTDLKGIIQPGKIFEYTEEIRLKQLYDIAIIPPLLDREDEMIYYQNWINDRNLSFRDFDALLLFGESRIGKTRLLEWMMRYATNMNLKTCHLRLTSIHTATPFLALTQIVDQILEVKQPVDGFEKEEKIVQILKYYSDDLCFLNHIINVSFAYYEGYGIDEQHKKLKSKKVFKDLVKSFSDTCVIFLDDLHNLDSFSWEYIALMLINKKIFLVLTFTRGKLDFMHSWFYNLFMNNNIRKISLEPLDAAWIPSLACQILDVAGVSTDLCDALKKKCKGFPGLVETFILHLFSTGALEIIKVPFDDLVSHKEVLEFPDATLITPVALDANNQATLNKHKEENQSKEIPICLVTNIIELNADINVLNLDALIIIQLDTLTPYQQLLIKIASVIGNVVSRSLLENIMYENDLLTTARAIKRLFAMRILSCANVKCERKFALRDSTASNISYKTNLTCECVFNYEPDNDDCLPKYAFCKVMKFRNRNSRKIFYELLPLNQKKEFHSRIVCYLENSKQKCIECGGTMMIAQSVIDLNIRIISSHTDEGNSVIFRESDEDYETERSNSIKFENNTFNRTKSEIFRKENIPNYVRRVSSDISMLKKISDKSNYTLKPQLDNSNQNSRDQYKLLNILNNNDPNGDNNYTLFNLLRSLTEESEIKVWQDLGIIDSQDILKENLETQRSVCIKIEKGVSQTNFSKCTCAELHIIIFDQLIHHATEAELKDKVIEFIITYSHLNILSKNIDHAIVKLEEAEKLCLDKNYTSLSCFNRKIFLGRIHSLRASALTTAKKYMYAKSEIDKALKIYNINLDKVFALFDVRGTIAALKLKRKKYLQQTNIIMSESVFCLNVATLLYSILGEENTSRIATLRALDVIKKINCNTTVTFDTLSNAIQLEISRRAVDGTINIEKIAKKVLSSLQHPIQSEELYVTGNYFLSVFRARTARAYLAPAIRTGLKALVLSKILAVDKICMDIIPDLFYLLLARGRIEEAVGVAKLLLRLNVPEQLADNETWYNALCIDMILDAGFQLKSPLEISVFAQHIIENNRDKVSMGRRRLIVGLWTYWLRANFERQYKRFEDEALYWLNQTNNDDSLKAIISAMRLAEGMLESLARKIDDLRKVVDLMELRSLADREIARLEKDIHNLKVVNPRLNLLKANSLSLSGRQSGANNLFIQALEESRRMNNRLEEALARATTENSTIWIQNARNGKFFSWQEIADCARTTWHTKLYKITATR